MLRILEICCLFLFLVSCTSSGEEPVVIEAESVGSNAAIIRNPVASRGEGEAVDTTQVARLSFTETEYLFGEVDAGKVIKRDFAFTNTGAVPLLIADVRSTCGCTVADYPEEPILPGGKGVIEVEFDTKHKYGRQRKPVTIIANTYPSMTTIYVDGTVINE